MTDLPEPKFNLDTLFDKYLHEELTSEEISFLRDSLRSAPENEARFASCILGDFLLREWALVVYDKKVSEAGNATDFEDDRDESDVWQGIRHSQFEHQGTNAETAKKRNENESSSATRPQPLWPLITSLIAFFLIMIPAHWQKMNPSDDTSPEFSRPIVARVTELLNPVWYDDSQALLRGQETGNRHILMKSGSISLAFASGAQAVFDAPLEILVKDGNQVFCTRGTTSAQVPPEATGFSVETPYGSFVDRGTEFFVNVSPESVEAGVLKGRVDMESKHKSIPQILTDTESVQIGSDGLSQGQKADFSRYHRLDLFYAKVEKQVFDILARRERVARQLDDTPNLALRLDFIQNGNKEIVNLARHGQGFVTNITDTSTRLGAGPLRGTRSILLRGAESGITLGLPDELPALSMMATVRIDRFNGGGNVLFASNKHQTKPGAILWQILPNGTMQLHFRDNSGKTHFFESKGVLPTRLLGTWITLSVTFQPKTGSVVFGVNGREHDRFEWNGVRPVALGDSCIGNTSAPLRNANKRSLGGTLSEFRIYNEAVMPEELTLYTMQ